MPGALDGLRVVDMTTGLAGPLATMTLGDHGADVVKVEPPGGDPQRSYVGSVVTNRHGVGGAARARVLLAHRLPAQR
jgi:crotonobetainyl-CoA:carnitine CoA-transferase CaiB-like acyl-CoA transferase